MIPDSLEPSPAAIDVLVSRAQAGDRDAFHALVLALQNEIRLFVAARTAALDLVEEAVQGAFVTAWERLADYEPRGTFVAWLKGIARNRLHEQLRLRSRLGAAAGLDALVARSVDDAEAADSVGAARHELVRLRACLERLPPRSRAMVQRRYAQEVPLAVLAQQFKQSVEALASLLQRVRRSLRACVEAGTTPP
jgi:RNA polymerase sigma-70 factor (ECF subfamily)